VVVAVLALPVGAFGSTAGAPTSAHPTVGLAQRPHEALAPQSGLAGESGLGRFLDAPALYRSEHSSQVSPSTAKAAAPLPQAPLSNLPPPEAPHGGARPSAAAGWIAGTVIDRVLGTPVGNVSVYFVSNSCLSCTRQTTSANGTFRVKSDPGPSQLVFYNESYLINRTFPTVVSGVVTNIGTVYLVHFATVVGRVVADLAGNPPLPGVSVTSISRDGSVGGPSSDLSAANGTFSITVDPFPIEVDFGPGPTYFGNATYADPNPWQIVNVGTILIEGGLNATVTIRDSVTQTPVVAVATYCSDRIDGCLLPGSGTGNISLATVAGPGFLTVSAAGYVTNVTHVPDIPSRPLTAPNLGVIDLLPMGSIQVTVNFTGGTPNETWPSALPLDGPNIAVWVCALSGMDTGGPTPNGIVGPGCVVTGVNLGQTTLVPALPLRDIVFVNRSWGVAPGFPVAETQFAGGVSTFPVQFMNVTWANVTPDHVTVLGTMNLSAGTYLSGTVALTGGAPSGNTTVVSVRVCSTVRADECAPSVATGAGGQGGTIPTGCPTGPYTFCAPAPPGPDIVTLNWGRARNSTWITVASGCCSQEGHPTKLGPLNGVFHLIEGAGTVTGTIGEEGRPLTYTPPYGWFATIRVCQLTDATNCADGSADPITGNFSVPAALGWNVVTASSRGFRSNTSWVYVASNNSTGVVELGPVASYGGQVLSAVTGYPVLEATVSACNVAFPHPCAMGALTSSSNGTYNGTLSAIAYPSGTYAFTATASGFDPETTFVNVTPGGFTSIPTLRLPPIGTFAGAPVPPAAARHANSSSPTTGSWVIGRTVDAASGLGVGGARLSVCQILSSTGCAFSQALTLTGGEFNLSAVHGAYVLWINGTHYVPKRVYLNASTAGTVDLGALLLSPYDRITGRVTIDPWESLFTQFGEGANQVLLVACNPSMMCGPLTPTASDGSFNLSAPAGAPDTVHLTGGGPAGMYANSQGGFNATELIIDVTTPRTTLNGSGPGGSVSLKVLGGETGFVHIGGGTTLPPAYFADFSVNPPLGVGGFAGYITGGSGFYAAFVPDGSVLLRTSVTASGLVPATSTPSLGTVQAGVITTGPNVSATAYGFVNATVRDASSHAPLSGISLTVLGGGPGNQSLSGSADSNGLGFVNVTAPPGGDAVVTGAVAYGTFTGSTAVVSGQTDPFGPINLTSLAGGGFASVRSREVNSFGRPLTAGAYDNVSARPVEGMNVVENASRGIHSDVVNGNDLGQYFLAAVPAYVADITFSAVGYSPLTLAYNLTAGRTIVEPQLNLTGNGILAGTVRAQPGNVTVPYATVVVCPLSDLSCTNAMQTNATGAFWIGAPAGIDEVTVQSGLYLANLTKLVTVTPDSFVELGTIPVFTFGTVRGFVRATPSGAILPNVNVSVCSKFSPAGGCLPDETVATDANGSFSIQSPPGTYVLYADAPGYNASRFPIVITPGSNLFVGTLFLESYGLVGGSVENATGVPLSNATVLPCPTYPGPCTAAATTTANGSYQLLTSPGPTTLTASAFGYLDGAIGVAVVSGHLVHARPIVLSKIPPNILETVSGRVLLASSGGGLPNALVVAREGGARVAQSVSGSDGAYRLQVHWGTVELIASAPNYRAANTTVEVHTNFTGIDFSLAAMTYLVRGVTFDGGTGATLAGVAIASNGTTLAVSDENGGYHLPLGNGTNPLVASLVRNGTIEYGSVRFTVPVAGSSVTHDITLPRSIVPLRGVVVSAATGEPLSAATVALWTMNGRVAANRSTDSSGLFVFATGPGLYNVSVTYPGFEPANQSVSTGQAGNFTTVSLVPISGAKSAGSGLPPSELAVIVGGVIAVGVAGYLALRARPQRPPPRDPDEEELLPIYEPPT
jgi:carboxypeptidase family protein